MSARLIVFFSALCFVFLVTGSWHTAERKTERPSFWQEEAWADSVLQTLSVEQKVGQLLMVAAYSNRDSAHFRELERWVTQDHVGGLVFFQGNPRIQVGMINALQEAADLPLWVGMDAEWGLSMRLDSTMRFPRQMMLGAVSNDSLIESMGQAIGRQLREVGVHVSFSPVLDVNNNPKNPVINSRAFGEEPLAVARKGSAYFQGLQQAGVLAVGKHFPGHGDTEKDSHVALPIVNHPKRRLQQVEWVPFQRAVDEGIGGLMLAHLHVPALDNTAGLPTSLSPKVVSGMLRKQWSYEGLTFTDALNMKGVTEGRQPGEVEVQAFLAGNDVLLFPQDPEAARKALLQAVQEGEIREEQLDERCKRILMAKAWLGLKARPEPLNIERLQERLHRPEDRLVNETLQREAMTLLRNETGGIPYRDLGNTQVASIALGNRKDGYPFQQKLQLFDRVETWVAPKKPTSFERKLIREALGPVNRIVVSLHDTKLTPSGNFGITRESLAFAKELQEIAPVTLVLFGNPYALGDWPELDSITTVLVAYEESEEAQLAAAEAIYGGIGVSGTLPVSISETYPAGSGLRTESLGRLTYTVPEATGLSSSDLAGIDTIVLEGIRQQAFPGCQVLVAHRGKVVYQQAFGNHTYQDERPVSIYDLYDLASITKIAATVAVVMHLDGTGQIQVTQTLGELLPELTRGTPYANIQLQDMLTHHAGLKSWIPFYQRTLSKGVPRYDVYSLGQSELYPYRVAENFYISRHYPDSMLQQILTTPLRKKQEYLYSDLGYYFLKEIIEKQEGKPLEVVADSLFYNPLGCYSTGFRPRERFDLDEIVPTEYDLLFRKQLVHGDVHDPGAAMLGGVGGHAGLFSNANDLAKVMQMFLQQGTYGGELFLSDSVVHTYTECRYCANPTKDNRRGLGFDKPVRDGGDGPTCDCVSYASFGHTGFTGTIAWADPEEEVIFIFLSNRVYPDARNRKLISLGTRTEIMQVIYDALAASNATTEE